MPRIVIEQIFLNPVKTDYFYFIKTQVVEDDMEIKNFVLEEDHDKIQSEIDTVQAEFLQDSENSKEDSDTITGQDSCDFLEIALQRLRGEKDYNIGMLFVY